MRFDEVPFVIRVVAFIFAFATMMVIPGVIALVAIVAGAPMAFVWGMLTGFGSLLSVASIRSYRAAMKRNMVID